MNEAIINWVHVGDKRFDIRHMQDIGINIIVKYHLKDRTISKRNTWDMVVLMVAAITTFIGVHRKFECRSVL